jgi:hypothetical protein
VGRELSRKSAVSCPSSTRAAGPGPAATAGASSMHSIIYIVGLIVVVLAILSFLGLR